MAKSPEKKSQPASEIILYQTEDGRNKIEVRLENENVWLTQQLMAELFQTTVPNISMHIRNIYADGELVPEATVKDFLTVRREGGRDVQRRLEFYNLSQEIFGNSGAGVPPAKSEKGSRDGCTTLQEGLIG